MMSDNRRIIGIGPLVVALVGGAVLVAGGCRRIETPKPSSTAAELWDQGAEALAAGRAEDASALFLRSLDLQDDPSRRRSAAMDLAVCGRLDLAGAMVEGRAEPSLAALGEAIRVYGQLPPPGHEDNPYVIAAIADAIAATADPVMPLATEPVRLSVDYLAELIHHWHAWFGYAADSGGSPPRVMALWFAEIADAAALAARGYIIHPIGGAEGVVVAHMGSRPAGPESYAHDATFVAMACEGPAELWLTAWVGDGRRTTLVLQGRLADGAMVVDACAGQSLYDAFLGLLSDPTISAGRVVCRDSAERAAVTAAAEAAGMGDRLRANGIVLTAADLDAGGTDYAADGQWLADLAGYIRYGRDVVGAPPAE